MQRNNEGNGEYRGVLVFMGRGYGFMRILNSEILIFQKNIIVSMCVCFLKRKVSRLDMFNHRLLIVERVR